MKIGVVGCGALGSFYGAKLHRDGQDVHFLLRSDYKFVRRRGVRVLSPEGDFHVQPRPARNPQEIGVCDLVLVALKTTANDQFEQLIPPLIGPSTAILTLQNGLGNEAQLAALFGAQKIMGGLCFVCLNRIEPGVIEHLAHGKVVLGEYQGWPEPRTHDVASMFRHAGVPCKVTDNLERAHWEKLAWNIPFNGLGVASVAGYEALAHGHLGQKSKLGPCLTTDQLLHDPRWAKLVRELMLEVITTANALGLSVPETVAEKQIEATRKMRPYKASTLVDYERRQPLEVESLFLKPLRAAKNVGVPTPRLEALCKILTKLNPS
jgi:2-dehydropantoate 2-reductase